MVSLAFYSFQSLRIAHQGMCLGTLSIFLSITAPLGAWPPRLINAHVMFRLRRPISLTIIFAKEWRKRRCEKGEVDWMLVFLASPSTPYLSRHLATLGASR